MAGRAEGKVALITGGASGIGRATATLLAQEGAKVVIADYAADGGEAAVKALKSAGVDAIFVKTDVTVAKDVEAMVAATVKAYGRLDYAFNNAGIEGLRSNIPDCDEAHFDRVIAIDLKGVWLCLKYELPQMVKQGGGSIVNTASTAGLVSFAGLAQYCAAKGGVVQLTRTAALEFAAQNIRVNCVCPHSTDTPMVDRMVAAGAAGKEWFHLGTALNRLGRPEEIAEAVLWLFSDSASFVTGHALAVDGGFVAA